MAGELRRLEGDSPDLLRAMLHEELLTLQRLFVREKGASSAPPVVPLVERFLGLVARRFREDGDVATYARALGVTAGHLHATTRRCLGTGAKAVISSRRMVEAKRLLWYSDRAAAEIALGLGFQDPSYFCRFFRRMAGMSPIAFRRKARTGSLEGPLAASD
jgi:AraC family transcriptional activator of pobA